MAFILRNDRRETENKTIRFPVELINNIEKVLEGKEINFSRFVIQACEYALKELKTESKTDENENN